MKNPISFSDNINDLVRLLIILDTSNRLKPKYRITENRIKLYDYYLKFPHTMFDDVFVREDSKYNFDEYYAFFHWKPDVIKYRNNINYLIAKGLIEKRLEESNLYFLICKQGSDVLLKMRSGYKRRLLVLAEKAIPIISILSDKKIEEEIMRKANLLSPRTGVKNNEN